MNLQEYIQKKYFELSHLKKNDIENFRFEALSKLKNRSRYFEDELYDGTPISKYIENFIPQNETTSLPTVKENEIFLINGKIFKTPSLKGLNIRAFNKEDLKYLKKEHSDASLHHALFENGTVIEIDSEYKSSHPLIVNHFGDNREIKTPLIVFLLKRHTSASVIEYFLNSQRDNFTLSETHFFLSDGAKAEHVQIHSQNRKSIHHHSTYSFVEKDASYKNYIFHLNGALNRSNLEINLLSPGANGENYSLFLTQDDEHSDIHTKINHHSPDTTSAQLAKGLLGGKSKGIFTGKIHIHHGAQRVSSSQLNRNLLLSEKAQVQSRPQLEIFADDVKCSHGSTTGQLSQEEIFYFQARGIPERMAHHLLAYGFGLEVVLKIQHKETLEKIKKIVKIALLEKHSIGE